MDVFFLISVFGLYPGLKMSFEHKVFAKTYFYVHVSVGILDFLHVRWTENLNFVDSLVMETPVWTPYFVTRKYLDCMQYYMMLLEQCGNIVAKDLATAI